MLKLKDAQAYRESLTRQAGFDGAGRFRAGYVTDCLPGWWVVRQRCRHMRRWLQDTLEFLRTLRQLRLHMRPGRVLFVATVGLACAAFVLDLVAGLLLVVLVQTLDPRAPGIQLPPEFAAEMARELQPGATPSTLSPKVAAELAQRVSTQSQDSVVSRIPRIPPAVRTWLSQFSNAHLTLGLCGVALLLLIAKSLLMYGSTRAAARMKRRAATNLRSGLFQRLLHVDLALFENRKSGEVAQVFHQETFRAVNMLDYLLMLIQRLAMVAVYVTAIVLISWILSLATLLLAGIVAAMVAILYSRLKRLSEQLIKLHLRTAGRVGEMFAGIRIIRSTQSEGREGTNFRQLVDDVGVIEEKVTRAQGIMVPLAELSIVSCGLVIVAGAYWFMVQPGLLSALELFGFCFALARLLPSLPQVYGVYGQAISMSGGLKELLQWLELPLFPKRAFGTTVFPGVQTALRFENISYQYPNTPRPALANFSLEILAGQTVALVGASGSGKSTVAGLLQRFREPTQGRITVDGTDFWDFSPESWHRHVAIVDQEAFLFHDTIRNNLAYGCPDAGDDDVNRAMEAAQLADDVREKPEGLNTIVGERGATLSGGQRQRLAIARALVRNPKLLILDEATSALDNVKERQVQAALDAARQGRTVVVIAHRLTTIRHSDKIVVLDRGRVAEEGTWDDLIARNGTFARLVRAAESNHNETI